MMIMIKMTMITMVVMMMMTSKVVLTPLIIDTHSLDMDLGYDTLCSRIELNNSSSSSPSKGGYKTKIVH